MQRNKGLKVENNKDFKILYKFVFNDKLEKLFKIRIDSETLNLIRESNDVYPEWTKLSMFGCSHCPLDKKQNEYCPIAVSLKDIIDFFTNMPSYEKAKIFVLHNERQYFKQVSVQVGVSSIIGIIMATSGCPILAKMKPLVKFHLPFSSLEETEFRVLSMYLLAQYFRARKGLTADWEMKGVQKIYEKIQAVNQNIAKKIANLEKKDTSINAVVVLNNFADFVTFSLYEMDLDHLEKLFENYFE